MEEGGSLIEQFMHSRTRAREFVKGNWRRGEGGSISTRLEKIENHGGERLRMLVRFQIEL